MDGVNAGIYSGSVVCGVRGGAAGLVGNGASSRIFVLETLLRVRDGGSLHDDLIENGGKWRC